MPLQQQYCSKHFVFVLSVYTSVPLTDILQMWHKHLLGPDDELIGQGHCDLFKNKF